MTSKSVKGSWQGAWPPYRTTELKLPEFVLLALEQWVKQANKARRGVHPLDVSELVELLLLQILAGTELEKRAKRFPRIREAADAWLRWSIGHHE
jgi:hypothetical protein